MQKTQWFLDKIGQAVVRKSPDGRTTFFDIDNHDIAKYAHDLQDNGYLFEEVKEVAGPGANVCIACEG